MTLTRNDFKGLLDSVDQLEVRRKRIEELRQTYIEALQKDDAAKQATAIEEAAKEGVELFQYLPLSELREVEQIKKLAEKLVENKDALERGRYLTEIKAVDIPELLKRLEALQQAVGDLRGVIVSATSVKSDAERQRTELIALRGPLDGEIRKLEDTVAGAGELLTYSCVQDTLVRLDAAPIETYERAAPEWLHQAEDALQRLPATSVVRLDLEREVSTARRRHEAFTTYLADFDARQRVRQIESTLAAGKMLLGDDVSWFDGLMQKSDALPAQLMRLWARANQVSPVRASVLSELSAQWWSEWSETGEQKAPNALEKKQELLQKLRTRIEVQGLSGKLTGEDREMWLAWYYRVQLALEMADSLRPYMGGAAPDNIAAFQPEQEYDAAWRAVGRWLDDAPDEVFCLLVAEWRLAYKHLSEVWDVEMIKHCIEDGHRNRQKVTADDMQAWLAPHQASEGARAEEKEKLGLHLLRQMTLSERVSSR